MQALSKLSKMKSILKKWHSSAGKMERSFSNVIWNPAFDNAPDRFSEEKPSGLVHADDLKLAEPPEGYKTVYVAKCSRRYFIAAEHLNNPLLRVLIADRFRDGVSVDCEVVLFEHLVWMLENADPEEIQSDSTLEELAQFYACN